MAETAAAPRTLLAMVAHPDDETFGCGALLARAAADGVRVVVCCASRGELGEDASGQYPTLAELGAARERELRAAADQLGVAEVVLLGLVDSGWDGPAAPGSIVADFARMTTLMGAVIQGHRPHIVVTLDPTGSDGHRDHAAVARAATEAFTQVVDWPATLYHWCLPRSLMTAWSRELAARTPDSVYLETELGRADAEVTTVLDGAAALPTVWEAIEWHRTQVSPYQGVSAELAEQFVRFDHLVRIHPPWSGGEREVALRWP